MFEQHFGLRETPFHSGHQMRFLYPSREHQEARAHLRYGIENREPFVLITGEVGTGKTTALYDALSEWGSQVSVALVTNSSLSRTELLEEICLRFGLALPVGASKPQALALLERHLHAIRARGEHSVLLLDESQNLSSELLEEIRLLSNLEAQGEKLVQIFLVGQPELEVKLADPRLRQLRQRISVHYRLNPLSPEETTGYVHHRVAVAGGNAFATFPPETCREVYRVTHGIPREINTVASQAMLAAFTEGSTTVQPQHVRAAASEAGFRSVYGAGNEPPEPWSVPAPHADVPASAPAEAGPFAAAPFAARSEPIAAAPFAARSEPIAAAPETFAAAPEPIAAGADPVAAAPAPLPQPVATPAPPASEAPSDDEDLPVWKPPAWLPPSLDEPAHAATVHASATPAPTAPAPAPVAAAPVPEPVAAAAVPEPEPEPEVPQKVERVEREELDAWTRAARDLMSARRQQGIAAPEPPASEPEPAGAPAAFPSPAELYARAANARPDAADLSGLPDRLRRKIEDDIAREERGHKLLPVMLGAVVVVALAVGAILLQRFQVIDVPFLRALGGHPAATTAALPPPAAPVRQVAPPATTRADSAHADSAKAAPGAPATTAASPAPETKAPAVAANLAPNTTAPGTVSATHAVASNAAPATKPAAPPATSASNKPLAASAAASPRSGATATMTTAKPATATAATPAPKPVASTPAPKPVTTAPAPATKPAGNAATEADKPAAAAPSPAAPRPAMGGGYGVGVGSYLDADRAELQRARLAAASKLPAIVVPYSDGGTTMYRVVLGRYPTNAAAERAAGTMMEKYGVTEGLPVKLAAKK